jgi:Fe-S cluster biogenesis protein NfuA
MKRELRSGETEGLSPEQMRVLTGKVDQKLEEIRPLLSAHFGGVSVDSVDAAGNVFLKFTGACAGCPAQPLTFGATVEPIVLSLSGVSSVARQGGSISDYARRRIDRYFGTSAQRVTRNQGTSRP